MNEDIDCRRRVTARLFAMLAARLEDAAQLAVSGQSSAPGTDYVAITADIASIMQEADTLLKAAAILGRAS